MLNELICLHNSFIAFVCENEERQFCSIWVIKYKIQLLFSFIQPRCIWGIQNTYNCTHIFVVMLPKLMNFASSADIPCAELQIFVLKFFNVESYCRNRLHFFLFKLHLIKNCSLPRSVETKNQNLCFDCRKILENPFNESSHLLFIKIASFTYNLTRKIY